MKKERGLNSGDTTWSHDRGAGSAAEDKVAKEDAGRTVERLVEGSRIVIGGSYLTRIVWGITGAGDYLTESLSVFRKISSELGTEVTTAVSREGEIVLKWYKLWDELNSSFRKVMVEKGPNVPFLAGPLQVGYYSLLVISPATANTTAKIAHGIADTLLTSCVAQAMKGGTPVYIYPIDQKQGTIATTTPDGRRIWITTRKVDVENVEKIRDMRGISILGHPAEIESIVASMTGNKNSRAAR